MKFRIKYCGDILFIFFILRLRCVFIHIAHIAHGFLSYLLCPFAHFLLPPLSVGVFFVSFLSISYFCIFFFLLSSCVVVLVYIFCLVAAHPVLFRYSFWLLLPFLLLLLLLVYSFMCVLYSNRFSSGMLLVLSPTPSYLPK